MGNYLKYTKQILAKMSFCPQLLNKEYRKCVSLLSQREHRLLNQWISRQKFAKQLNRAHLEQQH